LLKDSNKITSTAIFCAPKKKPAQRKSLDRSIQAGPIGRD